MRKAKKKTPTVMEVLKGLNEDVKELEVQAFGKDGHEAMISKPEVLELITDWMTYCRNPL